MRLNRRNFIILNRHWSSTIVDWRTERSLSPTRTSEWSRRFSSTAQASSRSIQRLLLMGWFSNSVVILCFKTILNILLNVPVQTVVVDNARLTWIWSFIVFMDDVRKNIRSPKVQNLVSIFPGIDICLKAKRQRLVVYLMLLGSSRPYLWLILKENGR